MSKISNKFIRHVCVGLKLNGSSEIRFNNIKAQDCILLWCVCFDLHASACIVLYLYIFISLLAVHTNQKRFQCERPRKKRTVLRERKEALGSPVNKVDRV